MKRQETNSLSNIKEIKDAKFVVGIDFGTMFSGFAYARRSQDNTICTYNEWPSSDASRARNCCKTQTSLWYLPGPTEGTFVLKDWGWTAFDNHRKAVEMQARNGSKINQASGSTKASDNLQSHSGHFLTGFKLCLADAPHSATPKGISVEKAISDYLKQLSQLAMEVLKEQFGNDVNKRDVKWCIAVPAIWSHAAKDKMVTCAQRAGIVQGPLCRDEKASWHPLNIVLEPEAASFSSHCEVLFSDTDNGSKFVLVDVGGGIVEVVVHEKVETESSVLLKEFAFSEGDFCGETFLDKAFITYLSRKIGCFERFSVDFPASFLYIKNYWEDLKCNFVGSSEPYRLDLPGKLARAWEAYHQNSGSLEPVADYDELIIPGEDVKKIFDVQVDKILKLIQDQLSAAVKVEGITVVGGFSKSPYLMKRIEGTFSSMVRYIDRPANSESVVCQGAVMPSLFGEIMMSRKSRKTYGLGYCRPFRPSDREDYLVVEEDGQRLCKNCFDVFVVRGDDVLVNSYCRDIFTVRARGIEALEFILFSTTDRCPTYVTDVGVSKEGSWLVPIPKEAWNQADLPVIEISMFLGGTCLEIFAKPQNFPGERFKCAG